MSVTVTFHTVAERTPKHDQSIIYLKPVESFGYQGFHPLECKVEYTWLEIDEHGDETGNSIIYSEEDGDRLEGHTLAILFDGYFPSDDWLWIDADDYCNALGL